VTLKKESASADGNSDDLNWGNSISTHVKQLTICSDAHPEPLWRDEPKISYTQRQWLSSRKSLYDSPKHISWLYLERLLFQRK